MYYFLGYLLGFILFVIILTVIDCIAGINKEFEEPDTNSLIAMVWPITLPLLALCAIAIGTAIIGGIIGSFIGEQISKRIKHE